jgi:hypothetical protein
MHKWLALLCIVVGSGACGDNRAAPQADASPDDDLLARLRALPNVADATETPTGDSGYHYIVLHFRQPVDHANPASPTFLQEVSLLHFDTARPLVVHTSGYSDYYLDRIVELTAMLGANQISIEHRYFGASRPDPADWSKLTVEQMAEDEHAIVTALRTIYSGKAISTGGSKGGMTAVFYRRFFPDDVDGTVPYVAPIMFANPDTRFPAFIAGLGPSGCHAAVQAVAIELISHRRAQIEALATAQAQAQGYTYTRVALGPAVESAIESIEWTFWQYFGVSACAGVPATTASDTDMFAWLDMISPVSDSDDAQIAFFDAYYYQAFAQLGYPDDGTTYLKPYYMYTDADFAGAFPDGMTPTYDGGAAMHDIDDFVQHSGDRLVFVYGQWDPWTGGAFTLGGAQDALELVQTQGTHSSRIKNLEPADRDAALARLAAWTGVTPVVPARTLPPEPRAPRMPPALVRALRAR